LPLLLLLTRRRFPVQTGLYLSGFLPRGLRGNYQFDPPPLPAPPLKRLQSPVTKYFVLHIHRVCHSFLLASFFWDLLAEFSLLLLVTSSSLPLCGLCLFLGAHVKRSEFFLDLLMVGTARCSLSPGLFLRPGRLCLLTNPLFSSLFPFVLLSLFSQPRPGTQ